MTSCTVVTALREVNHVFSKHTFTIHPVEKLVFNFPNRCRALQGIRGQNFITRNGELFSDDSVSENTSWPFSVTKTTFMPPKTT